MLELRWLQVPETTTKPPSLQYRIHQPVVDVGGHLCPGEWTDWTDVPTVVGEPSDTASPSAPVGVDEVAWRDAFIAERARRYRSEGMKIEQARIHAETDADLTTALTAQQPAAVSDDDGAEPGEPCESGLPDCGPAVAWDCEGIGACERCARELGWIATPHREPATPP